MKRKSRFWMAAVVAAQLQAVPAVAGDGARVEANINCPVVLSGGGRVYVRLAIAMPQRESPRRRPVNMAIVLDRSGSMAAEGKMENARAAVSALLDNLRPDDILSLVAYDDVVDVIRPADRVGRSTGRIKAVVQEITPRGWTNLGAGMTEGFRQTGRNTDREYTNRVILVSDGLANQGITDPRRLGKIARTYRSKGISLTTIGVGLEYDENLLVALSDQGGGNYYYLESARNLTAVLRHEFERLSTVLAQNAVIEITLGRGVVLHDAIGYEVERDGRTVRIPVGDLYGNDTRELMLEVDVPRGEGMLTVLEGRLVSDRGPDGAVVSTVFSSSVRYSADAGSVEKERDMHVQAEADIAVSTRKVDRAMEALDQGDASRASEMLAGARTELLASPAAAEGGAASDAVREQVKRLTQYSDSLRNESGDARRAKKGIQYDNYQTRKHR